MQILPVGVQSFRKIREENLLYVDKTPQLAKLPGLGKYLFLSRPRRFGKSLMLSTLKEIYSGSEDLFKGLWIEINWQWEKYPVIHLDLNRVDTINDSLNQGLLLQLQEVGNEYGIKLNTDSSKNAFSALLSELHKKGKKAVVLIDEYDKPITDYLGQQVIVEKHIALLKGFYGTMKSMDYSIHQAIITGVSKYGKLSIFSDLNNLKDISNHYVLGEICGLTETEIISNFSAFIQSVAKRLNLEESAVLQNLKFWYDGYSWDGKTRIYNPFSVLNFMGDASFRNYWFETGTPSFLISEIKRVGIVPFELQDTSGSDLLLESADFDDIGIISLLYQTGYLTILDIEKISDSLNRYHLGFPNQEVKVSFNRHLLGAYTNKSTDLANSNYSDKIIAALLKADWNAFFEIIDSLLASIPYDLFERKEKFFHALVHVLISSTGLMTFSEVHSKDGRMDLVLVTSKSVFIFEFKADKPAQIAMNKIKEQSYASRFKINMLPTVLIAVSFDTVERKVNEWLVEEIV